MTCGDFANPLRGILFILNEPGTLDLREVFRIVLRRKSQKGLVAVDGHNDRRNGYPSRIIPRGYFNGEGHSTLSKPHKAFRARGELHRSNARIRYWLRMFLPGLQSGSGAL